MKNIIVFLLIVTASFKLVAQQPDYDDLKVLYASKEYEKLVRKGIGYTEKDKTKNDALPYVWVSKGLYKISLSDNTSEKYKRADKDAINYLSKGLRTAKRFEQMNLLEDHADFIEELRLHQFYLIESDILTEEYIGYKRAYGATMTYKKIMNSEIPVNFLVGVCKYNTKEKSTANKLWRPAIDSLDNIESLADWGETEKKMLKLGVIMTAKAFMSSNQTELAEKLIGKVSQWFEGDEEWEDWYDSIINSTDN